MSSKRTHCTVEGAGSSRVVVEIEHINEASSSSLSKNSKPRREGNKRRKAAPKTIEFQVNGSLRSHAEDNVLLSKESEGLESMLPAVEDLVDPFASWMKDYEDVAHATDPVEPVEPVNQTDQASKTSQQKTPNYYLRQWKALHCNSYVQAMYDRDRPPSTSHCDLCQSSTNSFYRCDSCAGDCWICESCLLSSHRFQPTHRPKTWDGTCWVDAPLHLLGFVFNLGHRGSACCQNHSSSKLLIGDLNGFTEVQIRYCKHSDAPLKAIQLLSVGLFPCSDKRPGTAFTLQLLERLDAFATVGQTSAHKVYAVLERATRPGFPDHVSDRYRELLAAYRKFLHVTKLRSAGHLFQPHPDLDVHPGDQAFDCVACPRPGFNFEWKEVSKPPGLLDAKI
ncbi:hypothetical protein FRC12_023009 [Ceratobasidium sp. 428]|nr:hypothetical protein FRC12_023009 [Ceratobasidium sp. 428]